MGCGEKSTQQSSTQVTATPEERQLEQMQLDRLKANQGNQQQLDNNFFNLANTLLQGQQLPGSLQGAAGVSPQQTQEMVNASLADIAPQFQSGGILDSGAAAQIAANTAAGIRNQNAQFNVSALQNLLNQAIGSSSNLQANTNSGNQVLGGQLAGLRSTSSSGSTIGMNPFLKSFQQGLGNTLGNNIGSGFSGMGVGSSSGGFSNTAPFSLPSQATLNSGLKFAAL